MKNVYFDNASTTPIYSEVIEEMIITLRNDFGNPSSSHSFGRAAKSVLELSRKKISNYLNCASQEIIFTSTATEANNWILNTAVNDLKVQKIITTKIEHHAVLEVIKQLNLNSNIEVEYLKLDKNGNIDYSHLVLALQTDKKTLVSLMHINNEIGTQLDIDKTSRICKQHGALFHSDMVQSVGKIQINLSEIALDFMVASAHKFHGPKGVGFAFIRKGLHINPVMVGGEQEKGLRAGTESVHNIVAMAMALDISHKNLNQNAIYIAELKQYCNLKLKESFTDCIFIGDKTSKIGILNVLFPSLTYKSSLLLFALDLKGIAVSRGSACQSGSSQASHVLSEIIDNEQLNIPNIRISFSHFNTFAEIDYFVETLKNI